MGAEPGIELVRALLAGHSGADDAARESLENPQRRPMVAMAWWAWR
ncbi:hypothetical protein ACR9E3_09625 [Actinomycetospora sp. C-140]